MSNSLTGKPHYWRSGSTKPEVAKRIADWWTPERREARRAEVLERNPNARYHGLSSKKAASIVKEAGKCNDCGSTNRLDVHHRDRNKKNQDPKNITVLCHKCHMREHSKHKEIGWAAYHRSRAGKSK